MEWVMERRGSRKSSRKISPAGNSFWTSITSVSTWGKPPSPSAEKRKARDWLRRQQGRLLQNQWKKVLRALDGHLEPPHTPANAAPVRDAHRYISQRREHLDYARAAQDDYPMGSGEIESAHRHVIQQRLKLPGSWWTGSNAERMLNLRTARSNGLWEHYWN